MLTLEMSTAVLDCILGLSTFVKKDGLIIWVDQNVIKCTWNHWVWWESLFVPQPHEAVMHWGGRGYLHLLKESIPGCSSAVCQRSLRRARQTCQLQLGFAASGANCWPWRADVPNICCSWPSIWEKAMRLGRDGNHCELPATQEAKSTYYKLYIIEVQCKLL